MPPALVREGPGYPRNGTPMGVSLLALANLVMKRTIQVKARLNIILSVSYDAMHMAAMAVNGLTVIIISQDSCACMYT